jgi:hypothetical protein
MGVSAGKTVSFAMWAGGRGSISGGTGRLLEYGGNGEGCDELGAVFSVLPEGELLALEFCRGYILIVKVECSTKILIKTYRTS